MTIFVNPSNLLVKVLTYTMSLLYKTLIRAKMEYESIFYNNASKNHRMYLDRLQNYCIFLCFSAFLALSPLQAAAKIAKLFVCRYSLSTATR